MTVQQEKNIYSWSKSVFLRDLDITRRGVVYFVIAFSFYFIAIEYIVLRFISFLPHGIEVTVHSGIMMVLTIMASLGTSGLMVDKFKDRILLLLICSILVLVGLIFLLFEGTLLEYIGLVIILYFSGVLMIDLLTIVTHESTLLNRGRLTGYILFFASLIGAIAVLCSMMNLIAIIIIEAIVCVGVLYIREKYKYKETEERLHSHLKFADVLRKQKPISGYLTSFIVLGYILGNAFPFNYEVVIEPVTFIISCMFFLILAGVLMDKMGRKWTYVGGIMILSSLIIFSGVFRELYNALFFGIALPVIIVSLFTLAGDFSTERDTLKYRGRIHATFIFTMMLGIIGGVATTYFLTELYNTNIELLYWIPSLINGINSFLLIVLLVWLMPLPEVLSSRESNWADKMRNLYVFNKDSICLYNKNFLPEEIALELPAEDLITGGLTGILTLISEITNERRNLRIIDKDRIKIYFAYGKHVIVTLISSQFLPILFKKLDVFTKAFEREFEQELAHFKGKINPFSNRGDDLVRRYFKK